MQVEELVERLKAIAEHGGLDKENDHSVADRLLLEFINNDEVHEAYRAIPKWYA